MANASWFVKNALSCPFCGPIGRGFEDSLIFLALNDPYGNGRVWDIYCEYCEHGGTHHTAMEALSHWQRRKWHGGSGKHPRLIVLIRRSEYGYAIPHYGVLTQVHTKGPSDKEELDKILRQDAIDGKLAVAAWDARTPEEIQRGLGQRLQADR